MENFQLKYALEMMKHVITLAKEKKAEFEKKGLIPTLDLFIEDLEEYAKRLSNASETNETH